MLNKMPSIEELNSLIGESAYGAWSTVSLIIKSNYEMDESWNSGGKAWDIEYKFRKGGKTLCTLYAKKDDAGLMIIFGKEEREKFEAARGQFSGKVKKIYNEAKTFHDGKWVMFPLDYNVVTPIEIEQLLFVKKRPNKKLLDGCTRISLSDIRNGNKSMTTDMLFTYKRKTTIKNQTFKFFFEFDLTKEIKDADLADMVLYVAQRDVRMQEILNMNPLNEQSNIEDIISVANKYRKKLLEEKTNA